MDSSHEDAFHQVSSSPVTSCSWWFTSLNSLYTLYSMILMHAIFHKNQICIAWLLLLWEASVWVNTPEAHHSLPPLCKVLKVC